MNVKQIGVFLIKSDIQGVDAAEALDDLDGNKVFIVHADPENTRQDNQ